MRIGVLGATGKSGRKVVEQALANGDEVRVLVRSRARLAVNDPRLTVLEGTPLELDDVRRLAEGCDVIVSALGPSPECPDLCSSVARQVIAAGVKRYVAVSGAGIDVPGDRKDLVGRLVSKMVRLLTPTVFFDKVREFELLRESSVEWTLVRPPRLTDAPGTGTPRLHLENSPGTSISRADLATAVLQCCRDGSFVRKAPFAAG